MTETPDVVVVGAGLAGLAVAIDVARWDLTVSVVDEMWFGGHLNNMPYPVAADGATGLDLLGQLAGDFEASGSAFTIDTILDASADAHRVVVNGQSGEIRARALVAASGRADAHADVAGQDRLRGRGVSECVGCDAPLFQGASVVAVLDGPSPYAHEEVAYLAGFAEHVHILGTPAWAGAPPNVTFLPAASLKEVQGEQTVASVVVADAGEARSLDVTGVLALGMGQARDEWLGDARGEASRADGGGDRPVYGLGCLVDPTQRVEQIQAAAARMAQTLQERLG